MRNERDDPRSLVFLVTSDVTAYAFYRGYLAYLASRGWSLALITSDSGLLSRFAEEAGIPVFAINMKRAISPLRDIGAFWDLYCALRRLRPHGLVYATPKASLLGSAVGWLLRVPVREYQLWGLRFESEGGLKRKLLIAAERATCRLSTHVVANSRSLARAAKDMGLAKHPVVIGAGSSHGVDLQYFRRDAPAIPAIPRATQEFLAEHPGDPVVLFVGRVHRDKGIKTLISALESLIRAGDRFVALVVGPNEDEEAWGALLEMSGRTGQLLVVGPVADVRPYLMVADVLCLPTLREGFPNVVLEAAAMGIPAVVSDATGAVDSVIDGVTGWIFPVADADVLKARLSDLLNDVEERSRLGVAALGNVRRNYASQVIWRQQEECLAAVMRDRRQRPHRRGRDAPR